jgi:hypothetical protein
LQATSNPVVSGLSNLFRDIGLDPRFSSAMRQLCNLGSVAQTLGCVSLSVTSSHIKDVLDLLNRYSGNIVFPQNQLPCWECWGRKQCRQEGWPECRCLDSGLLTDQIGGRLEPV